MARSIFNLCGFYNRERGLIMTRPMKDSGIEWVGEIPEEWGTPKIGNICTVLTDYVSNGSFASLSENVEYLDEPNYAMLVRTIDISGKGHNSKPVYINKHAYDFLHNSQLFGGEIMLPNIGASVGDVYIVPILYEKMSLAPNAIILKTKYCDKYFYYYLLSDSGKLAIKDIAQSTAQAKFNKTDFKQIRVLLPSGDEQEEISKYLDEKCAAIDALIEQTRASIEEYKKLKQAVITEAVTKGIRPGRKMKDSGVEWIGEIPEEWSVEKIKYVTDISRGLFNHRPRNDERLYNGAYPFIQTGDVSQAKKYIRTYSQTLNEKGITVSKEFPKGTLTMTIAANVGDVAILDFDAYFPDSVVGFVPKLDNNSLYLFYIFSSMKEEFVRTAIKSTQLNLNIERVREMYMPLTESISEQQEITDYLDEKCAAIDAMIDKKEQLVSELESYKKSLIFEYVTGKKEVTA